MSRTALSARPLLPLRSWFALCCLAVAVLFLQGCASTPREPWLTADLTEEFRATKADEVRNFEDYLRLEDRLFAQLDAKVYARTETGSGTALERYSKGSASDPRGANRTGTAASNCQPKHRSVACCCCTGCPTRRTACGRWARN